MAEGSSRFGSLVTPHFILCPVALRPHDPRVRCTCDPVKLAAALEAERKRRVPDGCVLHTRPATG